MKPDKQHKDSANASKSASSHSAKPEAAVVTLDDKPCWRINGVWGNEKPRCEKLNFVNHCRNCDVFESAARELILEGVGGYGTGPDNGRDKIPDNTSHSFEDLVQQQRLSGDISILPFRIEGQCFAIPTRNVVTVHGEIPIHAIPFNQNKMIKGVAAINHEIYPFVDIATLLSLSATKKHEPEKGTREFDKRVLVVDFRSRKIAFHVDEVYPVYRYFHQAINNDAPDNIGEHLTKGRLLKESNWCCDCYLLDLESVSSEFENAF